MLSVQDILQPEIVNILGGKYRKTPYRLSQENSRNVETKSDVYLEEDYYYDEPITCSNSQYDDIIKQTSNGFVAVIEDIPSFYFKFIVGKNASTKNKIESETKTKISLPPKGFDGNIVINGQNYLDMTKALERITTLIELNKREQPAKHFLAIQLNTHDEFTKKFDEFKKQVLELKANGVDESIFQFPERLHLTICLIIFLNQSDLIKSKSRLSEIVENTKRKHFGDEGIHIRLHGIEYMNDDPSEVDVLYAKVESEDQSKQNCLQGFVDEVVNTLVSLGHAQKQNEHVKLHATVMNTLFRVDDHKSIEKSRHQRKVRETFDARLILKKFGSFDFGCFDIDHFDISIRSHFDKSGHYVCDGKLSF